MKRNATANWKGSGKEGKGNLGTQSGMLKDSQYSYNTRFENGIGTNPEELVAAAHAGCFSMKLSFVLAEKNLTPEEISTTCSINLDNGAITEAHLDVKARISGIDEKTFKEAAENAKANCPISKLLNTNITMSAQLMQ